MKGRRQLTMLRVETLEEAEAAERARVDILSVPPALLSPAFRDAAPSCFTIPGLEYGDFATAEDYVRAAFSVLRAGGDAVYSAASLSTIRRMRDEGIPVCGHVGLIPSKATWTGGFKAVGKTAQSALDIWRQTKALEEAGRTPLFMISMGAGAGCDAQYLFAEDILGSNRGHYPRHAKTYRNFSAEYDRLQQERVAAFSEFVADVHAKNYPAAEHVVGIPHDELDRFLKELPGSPTSPVTRQPSDYMHGFVLTL
eukprot:gene4351-5447_t